MLEKRTEGDGENAAMTTFNTSQKNTANVVGQQLLLNMLKFANQQTHPSPTNTESTSAAEPVANN
jgi:hypothetical protein